MADFAVGANLPWIDYGLDFGGNLWQPRGGVSRSGRRERLRAALCEIAASGAELLRMWVLADGRAGILEDAAGRVRGLDPSVSEDMEVALAEIRAAGLRVVLVLLDHLWLARPRWESGVRLGGRRRSFRDDHEREALVHRVLVPLVEPHRHDPTVAAWEVMNEPEWATFGVGTIDPGVSVSRRVMRRFVGEAVGALRARVGQPLTVGLARRRWCGLVSGLGLDLLQFHWYEGLDRLGTLARPVDEAGLGMPVLLGEYPTRGCTVPPHVLLETARRAGYAGALAWSAGATDRFSDPVATRATLAAWTGTRTPRRPEIA
jgi:hypothetical protein